MDLKKWHELATGGINYEAGNALKNFTGNYRRGMKPEFYAETCINCFLCWVFCPENAIMVENEEISGINYDYCKGCGICVNECPVTHEDKPLKMIEETLES
ncbi:MAG: 4Fe-4S dicluster domain-containing protein [bacterium]|nr:4Fe-4S dicluster domain-containing protein [bacterium]